MAGCCKGLLSPRSSLPRVLRAPSHCRCQCPNAAARARTGSRIQAAFASRAPAPRMPFLSAMAIARTAGPPQGRSVCAAGDRMSATTAFQGAFEHELQTGSRQRPERRLRGDPDASRAASYEHCGSVVVTSFRSRSLYIVLRRAENASPPPRSRRPDTGRHDGIHRPSRCSEGTQGLSAIGVRAENR